jgi:hypothetical protein
MRRACVFISLGFALSACAAPVSMMKAPDPKAVASPSAAGQRVAAQDLDLSVVVARSMPAVVLLLNTQADGRTLYGAGLLIEPGLVLTSQHVVAGASKLGAMLYRPGRTSYTPMDGGLSRFLFENQADIITAEPIDGDTTSDLALVRLSTETSGHPTLPIANDAVKPGDRVLALGHPQETVWSFTQGVVGSIEQGAIQHDASISHGSSGGPLLNARGEVVGINIAKVVSEATGLAFARPISLAARYLGERSVAALPLDLSLPEASAVSCWRAQEIGRLEAGECFDWEAGWDVFSDVAREAVRIAPPGPREKLRLVLADPNLKQRWIDQGKQHVAAYFLMGAHKKSDPAARGSLPTEVTQAIARAERERTDVLRRYPELKGIMADQDNPPQLQARLRLGIRVDRVVYVENDRAWVQLAGRNPDETIYRFSELYVKVGDRWLQQHPPRIRDEEKLPSTFAPPLETFARYRAHKLEKLVRDPDSVFMSHAPSVRSARPVSKPNGCTAADC